MICTSKTKSLTPFYTSLLVRPLQLYDLFDWMILHNNQYIKPRGILKKKYTRPHIWSRFFENQVQYLTKFSVMWVKRRQRACFLSPRSSKITVMKGKERIKRKSEEKERRRWKKKQWLYSFFIIATLEIVFGWEKLFDAKGPLGDNNIQNLARYT